MSNPGNDNNFEALSRASPWVEAGNIDWSYIISDLKPKRYGKNEVIFYQNCVSDYVYLVKEGRIRLDIYSPGGEEKTLFIADKGTFIGELSPIDGLPNICRAIAATDSAVYLIPKTEYLKQIHSNIKFASDLLYLFTLKIRSLVDDIKQLSFNDSYYRVCDALVHLVRQYATHTKEGYKLNMKFTHQEMGSLTGLSRVSVSNIISHLTSRGIIRKEGGYMIIKDFDSILSYLNDKK
ncbi:MAG: Crp/Fnr family transcriptional regulator [Clostridiaceae bacterium]|jgi:CRP-like cAMP-binding protein|nr:Crp/Fnr family transcriptional regulator [Clostridiaceae bacterium]